MTIKLTIQIRAPGLGHGDTIDNDFGITGVNQDYPEEARMYGPITTISDASEKNALTDVQ